MSKQLHQNYPSSCIYIHSGVKTLKKKTFLKNVIAIWYRVHQHIGDIPALALRFSPVWGNNDFTPGRGDGGFKLWATKGAQCVRNLYRNGKLLTFEQICKEYDILYYSILNIYN